MPDDPTVPDTADRSSQKKRGAPDRIPDIDRLTTEDLPVVLGRYEIQSILGQGGMARVFRAVLHGPAGFRKPVAVKFIKTEVGIQASKKEIQALIHEACLGGRLKHPNIVDVYELGEFEGQLFISMELVEGVTLRKLIQTGQRIPAAVVMEIAVGIASGLVKAHSRTSSERSSGLVHCDLKPSNLLLSWDGAVKIADFGISIPGMQRDNAGLPVRLVSMQGTPSYMSPEHMQGEGLDGRSDLFSLALVIAEMVLGANPLGESAIRNHLLDAEPRRAPPLDRNVVASLSKAVPGLGEVLLRCLAFDRRDRYPGARELLEDLQRLQDAVGNQPRLRTWLSTSMRQDGEETQSEAPTHQGDCLGPLADVDTLAHLAEPARSNLAPPLDAFVGRGADLAELDRLFVEGAALVTVKGTGGAGKTRLSCQYARNVLDALPGGAWFADLTEARSFMGVLQAVAGPLGVPLTGAEEPAELSRRLGQTIGSRGEMLLVLDNFEQVVDHAAATVGSWQALAPDARFLVTSRESLRLAGEVVFELAPLPPKDGLALFEARASSAGAGLEEDAKTRKVIKKVVARLDGLPLAIELAAARARMMSPEQILKRLSQRFKLLGGARRGDSARQATLRGLIDWSWDLLEPWEQSALAQVSVFRDGFFMEAAEAVVDLSAWPEAPWSLDVVGSLLDKSLLHTRQVLGQPRFEMYVSIQEYAAEKLAQADDASSPDAMQGAQRRQAAWFGRMGALEHARSPAYEGQPQSWTKFFCELENLIAGAIHGTPEAAAECCIAVMGVVSLKGPVSLGADLAARVLERPGLPRHLQMRLEIGHSRCLRLGGRMKEANAAVRSTARMPADSSEDASRVSPPDGARKSRRMDSADEEISGAGTAAEAEIPVEGEDGLLAILEADRLVEFGTLEFEQERHEAASRAYSSALDIYRAHLHPTGEGHVLGRLGNISAVQGNFDEALEIWQLALDIHREFGDKSREGGELGKIGAVYVTLGRLDEGIEQCQMALDIHREIGDKRTEGIVLGTLGTAYKAQGRLDEATAHYQLAIEISREVGNRVTEGVERGNLGDVLFELKRFDEAEEALQDAISVCEDLGLAQAVGAFRGSLGLLLASQGQGEEAHRLLEAGESQVEAHPEEYAKFLCKKGQVQLLAGELSAAHASLLQAQGIAKELDVGEHSEVSQAIAELQGLLDGGGIEAMEPSSAPASESIDEDLLEILEGDRLVELGRIERDQSNYGEAAKSFLKALEIFRKHGHRRGEGEALVGLAEGCRENGDLDAASDHYRRALEIHRDIGERHLEGIALGDLGNVCQQQGKLDEAIEHYKHSLEIHRKVGARRREGVVLGNLGMALQDQGKLDEGSEHHRLALEIHREIGHRRGEGAALGNLGIVLQIQGMLVEAIEHYHLAVGIFREIGNRRSEGVVLGNLGEALIEFERFDEAEEALQDAISVLEEVGFVPAAGVFRGSLAWLLASQGQGEEAHRLLEAGESQVKVVPDEHAKFLCKKGQVQLLAGDLPAAHASLLQAQGIAKELEVGDQSELGQAIAELQGLLGE